LDGLELAADESAHGAPPVRLDTHQEARTIRMRFVVRERPALEQIRYALASFRGIHGLEACGKRAGGGVAAQCQHVLPIEQ
jgi:hypothetical protein